MRAVFLKSPDALRKRLVVMYENHKDIFAGRRTNAKDVRERNQCMEETFAEVAGKLRA